MLMHGTASLHAESYRNHTICISNQQAPGDYPTIGTTPSNTDRCLRLLLIMMFWSSTKQTEKPGDQTPGVRARLRA